MKLTVGYKFRDAVEEALSVGIDNFNDLDRENVAEAINVTFIYLHEYILLLRMGILEIQNKPKDSHRHIQCCC